MFRRTQRDRQRIGLPARILAVFSASLGALLAPIPGSAQGATAILVSGSPILSILPVRSDPARGEVLREIVDPSTGQRWVLLRDPIHPAGPGQLLRDSLSPAGSESRQEPGQEGRPVYRAPQPVIRAGDRVILEESTPRVESRLEAVALGPARAGGALRVRLRLGGQIVRARALAEGRATYLPAAEARP